MLEGVAQSLAGTLLGQGPQIGQIVTVELSFQRRRILIANLYRQRHGDDEGFGVLEALLARAAQLEEKRNQITHSVWGAGRSEGTITRIKATAKQKRGLHFDFEQVSEDDLRGVATEIQRLAYDLQEFWLGRFGSEETVSLYGSGEAT